MVHTGVPTGVLKSPGTSYSHCIAGIGSPGSLVEEQGYPPSSTPPSTTGMYTTLYTTLYYPGYTCIPPSALLYWRPLHR